MVSLVIPCKSSFFSFSSFDPASFFWGGNNSNSADTANFLSLMQLLRQKLGANKLITAAVAIAPFFDGSQEPSSYLDPAWGTTVDYLNVMVSFSISFA
jgi:hypothetical protein